LKNAHENTKIDHSASPRDNILYFHSRVSRSHSNLVATS
jgi:hypothetical protein